MWQQGETRVIAAKQVALRTDDAGWDFADRNKAEIAEHWHRRSAENPHFFNGTVHMLSHYRLAADGAFSARFLRTDFASFLYWRDSGWPDHGVRDTVATALIRSREGRVLLCQQRAGHLNGGLTTPPGGFIDVRDVAPDGSIDVAGAVLREIAEETGLDSATLRQGAGYAITLAGPLVSIAVPWQSDLSGVELVREASRHIAAEPEGELARVLAVDPAEALATLAMPDYARALVGSLRDAKTPD